MKRPSGRDGTSTMHSRTSSSRLRLVGTWPETSADAEARRRRQEVIRENRRAAQHPSLQPTDPRWTLAVRAYSQLQGTTLTPERRERVLTTARRLGIRPFDANVIIAVVQDHARRGVDLAEAAPALEGLPVAAGDRRPWLARSAFARFLLALILAAVANALLIMWVV